VKIEIISDLFWNSKKGEIAKKKWAWHNKLHIHTLFMQKIVVVFLRNLLAIYATLWPLNGHLIATLFHLMAT